MYFSFLLKVISQKAAGVRILLPGSKQVIRIVTGFYQAKTSGVGGQLNKNCIHTKGQTQFLKTYSVSVPVCLYFEPSWVLYLPAADRKDHLFRHTVLNPGWFVTQFGLVSTSWRTILLPSESLHFSISWQHWHSLEFWNIEVYNYHICTWKYNKFKLITTDWK